MRMNPMRSSQMGAMKKQQHFFSNNQSFPRFVGPVATGTFFPSDVYNVGGMVGYNSATAHWATQDLTGVQLVFSGVLANNAIGGVVTEHSTTVTNNVITAVIEYPLGVYTRITTGGSRYTYLDAGKLAVTDWVAVNIPAGDKFIVYSYWENQAGGVPFVAAAYYAGNGVIANTAVPNDLTGLASRLGVPTTWATAGWDIGPAAILGYTTKRTFALIGDSRTMGVQAGKTDANKGCTGEIALAAYNAGYGMLNLGIGNDRASKYINSHSMRAQLANYCNEIVLGFGANDIFFDAAATILANTRIIRNYFPNKPAYLYTLPVVATTSTDNYATLVNQTPHAFNPVRIAYNNLLRAGVGDTVRTWEVADVLESARDSGKWRVDIGLVNGPAPGGDPTHENNFGNATIAGSGAIVF